MLTLWTVGTCIQYTYKIVSLLFKYKEILHLLVVYSKLRNRKATTVISLRNVSEY
jgi:hypothetical protein